MTLKGAIKWKTNYIERFSLFVENLWQINNLWTFSCYSYFRAVLQEKKFQPEREKISFKSAVQKFYCHKLINIAKNRVNTCIFMHAKQMHCKSKKKETKRLTNKLAWRANEWRNLSRNNKFYRYFVQTFSLSLCVYLLSQFDQLLCFFEHILLFKLMSITKFYNPWSLFTQRIKLI